MPRYSSAEHQLVRSCAWEPEKPAEGIADGILMSRGTSNGYLVTTDEGDVAINVGTPYQGARYRQRYEQLLGRPLRMRKIIFTQDHFDNSGGWGAFADPGVETIVQQNYPLLTAERASLGAFFQPRGRAVIQAVMPSPEQIGIAAAAERPKAPTLFEHFHAFDLGGRRFELYSAPSGETLDSVMVWLPREKVVFTGNWMGALYGAMPHFYTLRGDRQRSVPGFMRELERLIGFGAEMLVTGHDAPIVGAERVRADMTRLLAAVRHVHDETLKGMNAQKPLSQLMAEIRLPPELQTAPGRGPVSWYVRAVWEEYAGWFRHESTTELYATPASAIWSDLAQMAGGADALAARAEARLAAGAPVEALHYLEIALGAEPRNRRALAAEIAAHERLIDLSEGRNFDELGWLETKIARARQRLAET